MNPVESLSKQERKTAEILASAKAHFARHGFEATRLSEVARDAGVAVGTIYLRYEGKAELLSGVLRAVEQTFCTAMDRPDIWALPFPARFEAVMGAVIEQAMAEEALGRLMALSGFVQQAGGRSGDLVRAAIARQIRDGVETGQLRPTLDPQLVAALAYGMVEGALGELMVNPARGHEAVINELSIACEKWLS